MSKSTRNAPGSRSTAVPVDPSHATSSKAGPGTGENAAAPEWKTAAPEWKTEEWKHQVEAEARKQLKGHIRDVGASR
jgi:hypothetical protein